MAYPTNLRLFSLHNEMKYNRLNIFEVMLGKDTISIDDETIHGIMHREKDFLNVKSFRHVHDKNENYNHKST